MKRLILCIALFVLVSRNSAHEFNGILTADVLQAWGYTTDSPIMHLYSKGIQSIDSSTFNTFTRLENLDLSDNQLTSIEEDTFSGLKIMYRLLLNDNQLTSLVPDTFKDLSNLNWLVSKRLPHINIIIFLCD